MSHLIKISSKSTNTLMASSSIAFRELKDILPAETWRLPTGDLAIYRAKAGRNVSLVRESSKWLLILGTWFDGATLGVGDEAKLLSIVVSEGLDAVIARLEGFFLLIVGDDESREVSVVTDLAGSYHCYLRKMECGIAVCTSSSVLAAIDQVELDPLGMQEFINTGVIYEDRSLWKNVEKIAPAQVLTLREGAVISKRRYWRFADIHPQRYSLDESVERISTALRLVTRHVATRFPRPLCDLTGGYDSRATLAGFLMEKIPVSTTVSGVQSDPDVVVSTLIAETFGLQHRRIDPLQSIGVAELQKSFAYCDGECNLFEYARIAKIHEEHAEHHDISINGSFGELARGYWWELLIPRIGAPRKIDYAMLASKRFAAIPFDARVVYEAARTPMVAHFSEMLARANNGVDRFPNTSQMDNLYFTLRMQRWQGRIASSTNHIWPAISPYAFRSLLIPVLETRWDARIRSLVVRALLQKKLPTLANLPLEHGYPAIPASVWNIHRFRSIPLGYSKRAWHKLQRMAGLERSGGASGGMAVRSPAANGDEQWRALCSFSHLANTASIDAGYLQSFAAGASESGFRYSDQYLRLLSLEYSLTKVRATQERLRAQLG